MQKRDQSTLAAYVDLFLRRKYLFFGVFAVLFVVLGLGAMSMKTSFRATSLLAIGESEPIGLFPVVQTGRKSAPTPSAGLSGKTYATILEGIPMAEAVAQRIGGDTLKVDPNFIHRALKAEFYEPEVLEISAVAREPEHAVRIANTAAEVFLDYNRDQIRGEMQWAVDFVNSELKVTAQELSEIQNQIAEFKKREQVTDLTVEIAELLDAVTEFERDRSVAEADLSEERARYSELERNLFKDVEIRLSPLEDPAVRGLAERLVQLEGDLERARSEYGPEHPRRQLLESQVETARVSLSEQMEKHGERLGPLPSDQYYAALRGQFMTSAVRIIGLEARMSALGEAIRDGRAKLSALPPKEYELRSLQLRESITEEKFRRLLERLEAMEVEIQGIQGNATVLDLATVARPTLSRAMLLVYVAILSLLGAVGLVLTMEYRDNTIKSPDVITNVLRMTNFGFVPRIRDMGRRFFEESTDDHAFEHYRKLRANVRFSSVKKPIRCLMVTSSGPGEGKSSTITNLALALTHMNQRVLIVDTDLRRPSIARILELDSSPGVTDVLTGEHKLDGVIRKDVFPGLDVLPSGPIPPNPAELFESDRMRTLIGEIRAHPKYDIVLFDSAPTLLTTDTPVLAAQMDGVLVVLESGKTTEEQALATKEMLTNAGARVIGAVLNKVRSGPANGYYYYGHGQDRDGRRRTSTDNRGILGGLRNLGQKLRPGSRT